MAEFPNGFHIATVTAAAVEERFAVAELADFQQGFDRLGDFATDEGGLVAMDFILQRSRCGKCGDFCFDETMSFEGEALFCERAIPI
jgi:hypothetical protein